MPHAKPTQSYEKNESQTLEQGKGCRTLKDATTGSVNKRSAQHQGTSDDIMTPDSQSGRVHEM